MGEGFEAVERVARLMRGFERPWFVAGGWAVDLFLGRQTRPHEDVEIAIFRRDQRELRAYLSDWEFRRATPGVRGELAPWQPGEWLAHPIHEIHASGPGGEDLEILIDEEDDDVWRYRREPQITRPLERVRLHNADGVPYLAPEIVLLYKAKGPQPHDEQDFLAIAPRLDDERRHWFLAALDTAHPGHPWRALL